MIDWAEVDRAEKLGDLWILGSPVADAVLCVEVLSRIRATGRVTMDDLPYSHTFPFKGPRWPWRNPEALEVLADEPGFNLTELIANLPPEAAMAP